MITDIYLLSRDSPMCLRIRVFVCVRGCLHLMRQVRRDSVCARQAFGGFPRYVSTYPVFNGRPMISITTYLTILLVGGADRCPSWPVPRIEIKHGGTNPTNCGTVDPGSSTSQSDQRDSLHKTRLTIAPANHWHSTGSTSSDYSQDLRF